MDKDKKTSHPYLKYLKNLAIGLIAVIGAVAFTELFLGSLMGLTPLTEATRHVINAFADVAVALFAYIFIFKMIDKRDIHELAFSDFAKNASVGFAIGLFLQSFFILILAIFGGYAIIQTNPLSNLIPSFATAIVAGFVAELVLIGVFFRLTEEVFGSVITLIFSFILFAVIHAFSKNASFLSVMTTSIVAGILLPAAYIYSRSLWLPIFIHFAWDWAEPGIFGGINPGNTIKESLISSEISGSPLLTGGPMGPQNSIQSLILCSAFITILFWLAKRKNNFMRPIWKN